MILLLLLPALFIHKERDLALRQLLVLLLLGLGELAVVLAPCPMQFLQVLSRLTTMHTLLL